MIRHFPQLVTRSSYSSHRTKRPVGSEWFFRSSTRTSTRQWHHPQWPDVSYRKDPLPFMASQDNVTLSRWKIDQVGSRTPED